MAATARTRIKARILPRWPSNVQGGDLIEVERSGSSLTIGFTMDGLSADAAPAATFRLLGYDPASSAYRYVERDALSGTLSIALAQISDMSADARAFNAAADDAAMRTALGLGSAALQDSTAFAPAVHTHMASQISDATTAGRAMLTAASAAAQTVLLDVFTGDSGSGGVKGLVPPPGAGDAAAGKFLKADGTWAAGGGGGVSGPGSSTDNAAVRFDGTGGGTVQNSALIIADTTGALARTGGGGIPLQGTNTNDSAASGFVGELIESNVPLGSAVAVSTGVPANVTSISLTAGDWDVWAVLGYNPTAVVTRAIGSINTTSATHAASPGGGAYVDFRAPFESGGAGSLPAGQRRISLSATTTVYLVATTIFASGVCSVYGYLGARRVR